MTSGIYQLNFKHQAVYIGQSQDIETRMRQHSDKMLKGTAAKKMQQAYLNWGMPDAVIVIECHRDYLDILETWFINQVIDHPGCLNTSCPKLDPTIDYHRLLQCSKLLQHSAASIIAVAVEGQDKLDDLAEAHQKLQQQFNDRYMKLKAAQALKQDPDENEQLVQQYEQAYLKVTHKLKQLQQRNWFQRLFNYE